LWFSGWCFLEIGKATSQMMGEFAEFERTMIRERSMPALRAQGQASTAGTPFDLEQRVR
jgi:DNA invertase Pin-like site-specific DNA recombinase